MTWYLTIKLKAGDDLITDVGETEEEAQRALAEAKEIIESNQVAGKLVTVANRLVLSPGNVLTLEIHEAL